MEREEALIRLRALVGTDLRPLADEFGITVFKDGSKNKGWAGHVLERVLGLPLNSSRSPNFGSWELKLIPLRDHRGVLRVKETMAITMLDRVEVAAKEFEESHLFTKMRKAVIAARIFESQEESCSRFYSVATFDLEDPVVFSRVKADYDTIRQAIINKVELTGRMGSVIQPRTKGAGHGSTSRAFYARTHFVDELLGLEQPDPKAWARSTTGIWSPIIIPPEAR